MDEGRMQLSADAAPPSAHADAGCGSQASGFAERAVRVRRAEPADRAFVLGLAQRFGDTRAGWRAEAEVVNGTVVQLGRAFDAPRESDALFIALDRSGERAGFAYAVTQDDFFTGEPHGHLSEIASCVDGEGIGSRLMEAVETWARERGHRYLSLNVNDTNATAHRFYERREYVPEYRHLVKLLR